AHRLQARAQARDQLRPVAGECLRHVLVGAALARALGIELGIGLIGPDQRVGEGLRRRRAYGGKPAKCSAGQPDSRNTETRGAPEPGTDRNPTHHADPITRPEPNPPQIPCGSAAKTGKSTLAESAG